MQESLHTISPLTSPMGQMKSKRTISIVLIVVGLLLIGGAVGYYFYKNNMKQARTVPLTTEQKNAIAANMLKNGIVFDTTLTSSQKEAIIKQQTKEVASAPTLTPEEKNEIIKQMNSR